MTTTARLLPTALLLLGLAACGGSDDGAAAPSATAASSSASAAASPSPSTLTEDDAQTFGLDAQAVGLVVGQWRVDHDFTDPADDAEFQKEVDYQSKLSEGEKASYRKTGAKKFEVCVVKYAASEALGWGLYESTSGTNTYGVGAPTESFCP